MLCGESNASEPSQRHLSASLEMSHVLSCCGRALRRQMCRVTAATRGERGREAGSEGGMGRGREGWMGARVSVGLLLHLQESDASLQSEHVEGQMCTSNFSVLLAWAESFVQHDGYSASSETPTEGHCTRTQYREGMRVHLVHVF